MQKRAREKGKGKMRELEGGRKRIKTTWSGLFQPARNEHRVKSFIIYNTRGGARATRGMSAKKSNERHRARAHTYRDTHADG